VQYGRCLRQNQGIESPKDSTLTQKKGTIVLEYDLIRVFLEMLERQFQKERKYDYRHGKKTENGLKSVQEITVTKIAVSNLAEFCMGKQKKFKI
jgi:CRISPR-associated protein Cas1